VAVRQEAPPEHPTLRTHRIGIGLYDLRAGRMVRRDQVMVDVAGPATEVAALAGVPVADVLLLNDDDHTYAKLRLDPDSMAQVVAHLGDFDSSLARSLCWSAAWDMLRDGELAARDYLALVARGLPAETDINLIMTVLAQVQAALNLYADPAWAPYGWRTLRATALAQLDRTAPGSGYQLAWARTVARASRTPDELVLLREWRDGAGVPDGLRVDTELRWLLLQALAAGGLAGEGDIQAELDADRTASGERQAAVAGALVPTSAAKQEAWRRLTAPDAPPNWLQRSLLSGLYHPDQLELTEPYVARYFAEVGRLWDIRDGDLAQGFAVSAYPALHVGTDTVARSDSWLAEPDHPSALRRLVAEGRDGVVRSLRARAVDTAAGDG